MAARAERLTTAAIQPRRGAAGPDDTAVRARQHTVSTLCLEVTASHPHAQLYPTSHRVFGKNVYDAVHERRETYLRRHLPLAHTAPFTRTETIMTNRAPDPEADAIIAEHLHAFQQHAAAYGDSPIDVSRPAPARRYNELQGGKDNFQADRDSAAQLQAALPTIRLAATELRRCLQRQVAYLAERGVRQFIDIGCGLPHEPNVHEIAQNVDPSCRIVYVDNDR